jgi:hypothetical protein
MLPLEVKNFAQAGPVKIRRRSAAAACSLITVSRCSFDTCCLFLAMERQWFPPAEWPHRGARVPSLKKPLSRFFSVALDAARRVHALFVRFRRVDGASCPPVLICVTRVTPLSKL